jgi:hypothetical protein
MSPQSSSDPIRRHTVKAIANAIFAELYLLGRTGGASWDDIHAQAGKYLDIFLKDHSRLPTLEDVNGYVRATLGVTGP